MLNTLAVAALISRLWVMTDLNKIFINFSYNSGWLALAENKTYKLIFNIDI